jgi:hypothetical protein
LLSAKKYKKIAFNYKRLPARRLIGTKTSFGRVGRIVHERGQAFEKGHSSKEANFAQK